MDKKTKAFLYRVWNTVKYPLGSVLLGISIKVIEDIVDANTISVLASWGYWDSIVVLALQLIAGILGIGVTAGADKVLRLKK